MSISSYTTVTMLDSRPAQITLSVPKSTDITNRIITFKDLYGSASNSTIILVTRSGDSFEDGTFSTIMSNAYQTVNLYAGLPGKWLNVGATGGGGDSAGLTTVSNHLNAISTNVITISTNLNTVSNTTGTNTTNITTVSNTVAAGRFPGISTNTISTNIISTNTMSANQYYGDGYLLTGITAGFVSTAIFDLNMNGNYLKDLTGHVDISGASINMHTSSIQQYLNFVPVAQPIIQFGSWSADAANTDTTGGPYTIPITSYDNTNYCIYITGKYTTVSAAYTAVPVDASNFNVYFVNGDTTGSNIFYWQTMGYYGSNAGPAQGSGGGGGGGTYDIKTR